jgi:hypothetical protein
VCGPRIATADVRQGRRGSGVSCSTVPLGPLPAASIISAAIGMAPRTRRSGATYGCVPRDVQFPNHGLQMPPVSLPTNLEFGRRNRGVGRQHTGRG